MRPAAHGAGSRRGRSYGYSGRTPVPPIPTDQAGAARCIGRAGARGGGAPRQRTRYKGRHCPAPYGFAPVTGGHHRRGEGGFVESSFRLGRIAGVDVGVNWSWLVVFALITWSLAAGVFPDQDPGRSQAVYIAMAVVAAVLFFTSLLAHELGHAVTARREGMELDGITLWLFGGVARFK